MLLSSLVSYPTISAISEMNFLPVFPLVSHSTLIHLGQGIIAVHTSNDSTASSWSFLSSYPPGPIPMLLGILIKNSNKNNLWVLYQAYHSYVCIFMARKQKPVLFIALDSAQTIYMDSCERLVYHDWTPMNFRHISHFCMKYTLTFSSE